MGRLNDAQRHEAVGMFAGGLPCREIARRMNCAHSTILRLVQRHNETGSVNERHRSGRQRVTTAAEDRHIVLRHLRNGFRTETETAREDRRYGQQRISRDTVRRRLLERDLQAHYAYRGNVLTAERRRNRELWCQRHLRWTQQQWKQVLFTDESRFCLDMPDRRAKVWRRRSREQIRRLLCKTDISLRR